MNPKLAEIDKIYRKIEPYFSETAMKNSLSLENKELSILFEKRKQAKPELDKAHSMFSAIAPEISPNEFIEAYQICSELLRFNISGYISRHSNKLYVPLMKQGIRENQPYAYLFLTALRRELEYSEFLPILLEALEAEAFRTVETALSVVHSDQVVDALVQVEKLAKSHDEGIRNLAGQALKVIQHD